VNPEFTERTGHGCDDIMQASRPAIFRALLFSFAAASTIRRKRSLRAFADETASR